MRKAQVTAVVMQRAGTKDSEPERVVVVCYQELRRPKGRNYACKMNPHCWERCPRWERGRGLSVMPVLDGGVQ